MLPQMASLILTLASVTLVTTARIRGTLLFLLLAAADVHHAGQAPQLGADAV